MPQFSRAEGPTESGRQLYFGSPNTSAVPDAGGYFSPAYSARKVAQERLSNSLTKDPRLDLVLAFLANCTHLERVYSYGFSFGEADHEYVEKITSYCDDKTTWIQHCYRHPGSTTPLAHTADGEAAKAMLKEKSFPGRLQLKSS